MTSVESETPLNLPQRVADAINSKQGSEIPTTIPRPESEQEQQYEKAASRSWIPRFDTLFKLLVASRLVASLISNIQDSDEVYNFWEPLHYLEHGFGFQTWEYAPKYALRSWGYIALHQTFTGFVGFALSLEKIQVFYLLRGILALTSAIVEALFCDRISRYVHPVIATFTAIFLIFSPGMFTASNAFLPSSFAMYAVTYALGIQLEPTWTTSNMFAYMASICIASIWGWPLAALLGFTFILDHLFLSQDKISRVLNLQNVVSIGFKCVGLLSVPLVLFDYLFYDRLLFAPANWTVYKLLTMTHGTIPKQSEPWYFYMANTFLNFNIAFILALLSAPLLALLLSTSYATVTTQQKRLGLMLAPVYFWLLMTSMFPQKAEKYMHIIHPLICFNAAVGLFAIVRLSSSAVSRLFGRRWGQTARESCQTIVPISILSIFIGISILRILGLHIYYHAPLALYSELWSIHEFEHDGTNRRLPTPNRFKREITICVANEWERFPSHYFLPAGHRLGFIKGDFSGQLPTFFGEADEDHQPLSQSLEHVFGKFIGRQDISEYAKNQRQRKRLTHLQVDHFNHQNKPRAEQYVNVGQCDYLVEKLDSATVNNVKRGKAFRDIPLYDAKWNIVTCNPFLDAEQTHGYFAKNFWYPSQDRTWSEYCLLVKVIPIQYK